MTSDEEIDSKIIEIWHGFSSLEQTHPSDKDEFHRAIHDLQKIMGMRMLRREFPEKYPTYNGYEEV